MVGYQLLGCLYSTMCNIDVVLGMLDRNIIVVVYLAHCLLDTNISWLRINLLGCFMCADMIVWVVQAKLQ